MIVLSRRHSNAPWRTSCAANSRPGLSCWVLCQRLMHDLSLLAEKRLEPLRQWKASQISEHSVSMPISCSYLSNTTTSPSSFSHLPFAWRCSVESPVLSDSLRLSLAEPKWARSPCSRVPTANMPAWILTWCFAVFLWFYLYWTESFVGPTDVLLCHWPESTWGFFSPEKTPYKMLPMCPLVPYLSRITWT